jgi:LysR family positive regulator for ilvC
VDITVAALPDNLPQRVEFLKILETPLVFIVPSAFPETIRIKNKQIDWKNTPIIMADFGLSRDRTDRWFFEKDIVPNVYAQVAGNEAIIAMVALGCGVGVVPGLVLEKSPLQEQIDIVRVEPQLESFSIGICTMKKNMRLPQVDAFWQIAASVSLFV